MHGYGWPLGIPTQKTEEEVFLVSWLSLVGGCMCGGKDSGSKAPNKQRTDISDEEDVECPWLKPWANTSSFQTNKKLLWPRKLARAEGGWFKQG